MVIRVVTDSVADIPADLVAKLNIVVVPLTVTFGQQDYLDGIDITSGEFFQRLALSGDLPKTTQPSIGAFQEVYEKLTAEGNEILSIHASSKLSGTFNSASQAVKEVKGIKIEMVDTMNVSLAEGLTVIAAARMALEKGVKLEEVAGFAKETASKVDVYITVDTLEFLRRGGRIGKAAALVGTLLKVKPILTIREGAVHPYGKARTRVKAVEQIKEIVMAAGPYAEIAVIHATTPGEMKTLKEDLQGLSPNTEIIEGTIGATIGTHGGPGVLGVVTRKE
jgi:DegV family protein with EDD domain